MSKPTGIPQYDEANLRRILRDDKFGHLTESQFELLMATCQKRDLDPWLDHFIAEFEPSGRLRLIVTLEALRDRGESTGEYRGRRGPRWCGEDGAWQNSWPTKTMQPTCARVGIRRIGHGVIWATANWDAFAQWSYGPRGKKIYADFWERMGYHMLAKCAEALAWRAAFPKRMAGLLTHDEMGQARNPTASRPVAVAAAVAEYAMDDDSAPTTEFLYQKRLARDFEMGMAEINAANERMMKRFPGIRERDPRAFYALSLRELAAERAANFVTA